MLLFITVSCSEGTPEVDLLDVLFEEPKLKNSDYIITDLDQDITVQGTCDPRTDGFMVQWSDGDNWGDIGIVCKLRTYTYKFVEVGHTLGFTYGLAESKQFTIKAVGNNDKENMTTVNVSYEPINVPLVTIDVPISTNTITVLNETNFDISGTCTENGELVEVTLVDDFAGNINLSTSCVATGWSFSAEDVSSLADGGITITATHDAALATSVAITKNTTLDAVDITSPVVTDFITLVNENPFTVSGNCSNDGTNVHVNAEGVTDNMLCTAGFYSFGLDLSGVAEGPVNISVTHGTSPGASVIVTKDITNPTQAMSSPLATDFINMSNETSLTVSGTCSEPGEEVTISADDTNGGTSAIAPGTQPICTGGNTFSVSLDLSSLDDDTITITADHMDAAGNVSTQDVVSLVKDTYAPTVTIEQAISETDGCTFTAPSDPTNFLPIEFKVVFGEPIQVVDFAVGDITQNGTATVDAWSIVSCGDNKKFKVSATLITSDGTVIPTINTAAVKDVAGNDSESSTSVDNSVIYDGTDPGVVLSTGATEPTNASPFSVTATFDESVINFVVGDVSVGNGSVGNFSGSGTTYTFDITPAGNGLVTIDVNSGVAQDGAGNNNTAAVQLSRTYDGSAPTVSISGEPTGTNAVTVLSIDVLSTDGVTQYKYKVGEDPATDCSVAGGYSAPIAEGTDITDSIVALADGVVELCVIGFDGLNWQAEASATIRTWTKDTTAPTVTISGEPTGTNSVTVLSIDVLSTDGVTQYKYKVGEDPATDCSVAAGYSSPIAEGTDITDSIVALADGPIELCVIGFDGLNWQAEASATTRTWTKDTVSILWTGATDNSWSDTTNWSPSVVPGPSHVAKFDSSCGANCNVTIDASASVKGIDMQAGYTGTITQSGGQTITVGADGWVQNAGTFVGGDSIITVDKLDLQNGTFTATSGSLEVGFLGSDVNQMDGFIVTAGVTYNHNNGTLVFKGQVPAAGPLRTVTKVSVPAGFSVYNLSVDVDDINSSNTRNGARVEISAGQTIIVEGNMYLHNGVVDGGTLEARGDVNVYCITAADKADCFGGGNTNLIFNGSSGDQNFSTAASAILPEGSITLEKSVGHLIQLGNMVFNKAGQDVHINDGTWDLNTYDLTVNDNLDVGDGVGGANTAELLQGCSAVTTGSTNINADGLVVNSSSNPNVTITDANVDEGGNLVFTVNLTEGICATDFTVNYTAYDGMASTADSDYNGTPTDSDAIADGVLTISGGATSGAITVATTADGIFEPDENMLIVLDTVSHGSLIDDTGVGLIENDDDNGYTWTGDAGDNDFSNGANWSNGSTAPGNSDVVAFTDLCNDVPVNCAVNINSNVDVSGIWVSSSYPSTITQSSGSSITMGPGGFLMQGGTFLASDSPIDIAGSFAVQGATYTSSTETVILSGSDAVIHHIDIGATALNNLDFAFGGVSSSEYILHDNITVTGNLVLNTHPNSTFDKITGYALDVEKDIAVLHWDAVGSTTQIRTIGSASRNLNITAGKQISSLEIAHAGGVLNFVGADLKILDGFTHTSGTVAIGTSMLRFGSSTINPGAVNFHDVIFEPSGGQPINITGSMNVNDLTIDKLTGGINPINGGTVNIQGDLNLTDVGGGSTNLILNGTSNQNISYGIGTMLNGDLRMDKASGDVNQVGGPLNIPGDLFLDDGNWRMNGKNLTVNDLTIAPIADLTPNCTETLIVNGSLFDTGERVPFCAFTTAVSLPFNDEPSASLNTQIESNIIQINGITGLMPVDIVGAGSPQFRTCDSSDCSLEIETWGDAQQTVVSGNYLQIRLTSSGTNSSSRQATISVGDNTKLWDVTTEPPPDGVPPDQVTNIDDGEVYSSKVNSPLITWDPSSDTGGSGFKDYQLKLYDHNGGSPILLDGPDYTTDTFYTFTGQPFVDGGEYYVEIIARDNALNESTLSNSDHWFVNAPNSELESAPGGGNRKFWS